MTKERSTLRFALLATPPDWYWAMLQTPTAFWHPAAAAIVPPSVGATISHAESATTDGVMPTVAHAAGDAGTTHTIGVGAAGKNWNLQPIITGMTRGGVAYTDIITGTNTGGEWSGHLSVRQTAAPVTSSQTIAATMSSSSSSKHIIGLNVAGASALNLLDNASVIGALGSGAKSLNPSVTTSVDNALLLLFLCVGSDVTPDWDFTPQAGTTEVFEEYVTGPSGWSASDVWIGSKVVPVAGAASIGVDWTASIASSWGYEWAVIEAIP